MGIDVRWYNDDQKIIFYDFMGAWGWQDIFTAIENAVVLMDSVDHKVAIVLDFSKTSAMPNMSMSAMQKLVTAPTAKHPNMTYFYLAGARPYIRSMLDVFGRIFPKAFQQYRLADNVANAVSQINNEMTGKI